MKWKGNEALRKFLVPIDKLKPNPNNVRRHGPASIAAKKRLLAQVGQQRLFITDKRNNIQAGNGHYMAAVGLDWTHVAAAPTTLSKELMALFRLSDNRTGELSEFIRSDLSLAVKELRSIGDDAIDLTLRHLWTNEELDKWAPPPEFDTVTVSDEHPKDVKMAKSIRLTRDQRITIDRAIEKIRSDEEDKAIPEGRCLELICAEFLS